MSQNQLPRGLQVCAVQLRCTDTRHPSHCIHLILALLPAADLRQQETHRVSLTSTAAISAVRYAQASAIKYYLMSVIQTRSSAHRHRATWLLCMSLQRILYPLRTASRAVSLQAAFLLNIVVVKFQSIVHVYSQVA